MTIKSWFMNKEFSQQERYVIEVSLMGDEFSVERETEKAMLLKFKSEYGNIKHWFPKSVLIDEAPKKVEVKTYDFEIGDKVQNPKGQKFTIVSLTAQTAVCDNGKTYLLDFLKKIQ